LGVAPLLRLCSRPEVRDGAGMLGKAELLRLLSKRPRGSFASSYTVVGVDGLTPAWHKQGRLEGTSSGIDLPPPPRAAGQPRGWCDGCFPERPTGAAEIALLLPSLSYRRLEPRRGGAPRSLQLSASRSWKL